MKYRQRLVSSIAPAFLQEWLDEELERRGIDGVYTRYILSLLLADTIDPAECAHLTSHPDATVQLHHVSENRLGEKPRHRRLKSWEHEEQQQGLLTPLCQQQHNRTCCDCCQPYLNNEQRKKLAAVECLKSASEQKVGLEKLIDEVCAKLKNFQADIETNPDVELHAQIKTGSKQSTPQGQAELYYAAFPALIGRSEPLSELCHQSQFLHQEAWNFKSTAWGKESRIWKGKLIDIHKLAQKGHEQGYDCDDYSEKENLLGESVSHSIYPKVLLEVPKDPEFLEDVETAKQPLFIVPKMKVPPTKVANITMYTPFTSAATYQQQGVVGRVGGKEDVYSYEGEEDNINEEGVLLPGEQQYYPWGLSPISRTDENDLVTDLVSKFNSELASIWETNGSIQEHPLDTDNLGFSFSILSVRSPVQEVTLPAQTSISFFIGSSLPSVWSANTEDIKMLSAHDNSDLLELPPPIVSIPSLLHNFANHILADKVEQIRDDSLSLLLYSEEDSDFFLDDGSSLKSFKLDLSEQAWEDISQACEANSEDHTSLYICPEGLFVDPEDNGRSASFSGSSDCLSPLESTAGMITGIYSLWETPSPQPPFPLKGEILHLPLTTTPYNDKVVNWISHQQEVLNDNWLDLPSSKDNRTITYHKGESRFKEVVPLGKLKLEALDHPSFLDENKMSLNLDDYVEEKKEEPEENLLTSPKTHFQPIRQDSSESESLSDTLEGSDLHALLLSPHHHRHHQSPLVVITTPDTDEEVIKEDSSDCKFGRSISSSMDEMVLLTGQFEPDAGLETGDSPDTLDMLQAFQSELKPELHCLQDKSTSTDAHYGIVESNRNEEGNMLGFGSFRKGQIWSTDSMDEPISELSLPWKWSTTEDSEDLPWKVEDDENEMEDAFEDEELDYTLEAMRKELEQDQEELFRDINLLSDSEDYEAAFGEEFQLFSVKENLVVGTEMEAACTKDSPIDTPIVKEWQQETELVESANYLNDSKNDDSESLTLPSIPIDKMLYSSELENEWHKASEAFNIQVPKKGKSKMKLQGPQQQTLQRKPCSFFLEGNCRRSDCKFSHNLGTITCRFWEEGSCFKGMTCPFLHGYASNSSLCQSNSGKFKFALESEADFPSLSALSSDSSCNPFPKELVVGRIIRPKKKKIGPVSSGGKKSSLSPLPK